MVDGHDVDVGMMMMFITIFAGDDDVFAGD